MASLVLPLMILEIKITNIRVSMNKTCDNNLTVSAFIEIFKSYGNIIDLIIKEWKKLVIYVNGSISERKVKERENKVLLQ